MMSKLTPRSAANTNWRDDAKAREKLTELLCSCYCEDMDLQENAKIQNAIADHLASGKYSSAEEVVLVALEHLASEDAEHEACLVDMQESIADEKAGRVKEAGTVFADIRAKHDFSDPA